MNINKKALDILCDLIIGDGTADYRGGRQLVEFFNELGFDDRYGQGFPSRRNYALDRLTRINGTPELDKCIEMTFSVVDHIERIEELDESIKLFNKYLAFDKWQVVRDNDVITFKRLNKVVIEQPKSDNTVSEEDIFLKQTFNVNVGLLGLDPLVTEIIKQRLLEVEKCVKRDAPLSAVFMIGSIMEGILLGTATSFPREFNQAPCSPKNSDGTVKRFPDWTLNNFIDVSAEIGILKRDVKKFSHVVRDFRNYIHPYSQMVTGFSPDKQTALICFQVLKAAIYQISEYRKNIQITTR